MLAASPQVRVEQGPPWLVDLYFSPPVWLNPAIKLLAAIAFAIVVYRLHQRGWRLDTDTQREMQVITGTIVAVVSATLAMVNLTAQPYLVDVSVGFALGYGAVQAAQRPALATRWVDTLPNVSQRRATVWLLLAVGAFVLPSVIAVNGQGTMLTTSRLMLFALSMALAFYNFTVEISVERPDATGR